MSLFACFGYIQLTPYEENHGLEALKWLDNSDTKNPTDQQQLMEIAVTSLKTKVEELDDILMERSNTYDAKVESIAAFSSFLAVVGGILQTAGAAGDWAAVNILGAIFAMLSPAILALLVRKTMRWNKRHMLYERVRMDLKVRICFPADDALRRFTQPNVAPRGSELGDPYQVAKIDMRRLWELFLSADFRPEC